jgi:hypothetical protein
MLFYFHPDLGLLALIALFVTVVPLSIALLALFVISDVMKWKQSKEERNKKS